MVSRSGHWISALKRNLLLIVALCILAIHPGASYGTEFRSVRIVASETNAFTRDTAQYLANLLKRDDPGLDVESITSGQGRRLSGSEKYLLVLVGESALADADAAGFRGSITLALLPQRVSIENAPGKFSVFSVIRFEQPLARLFNLAALMDFRELPRSPAVLGIVATQGSQRYLAGAESIAAERKQKVHVEWVDSAPQVGRAVARTIDDANIMFAIPDPIVHTANTVQPILLMTYRAGIPVVGYSAAYLHAGAAVALYSTPEQLAQQAAETIAAYRAGKPVLAKQEPRYFTVGVNTTVTRSLGISLPDAEVLEQKLRSAKE